jgi:two-component system, LytTR family, sensor kinase
MKAVLGYRSHRHLGRTYAIIGGFSLLGFLVRVMRYEEFGIILQLELMLFSFLLISSSWEMLRFIDRYLDRRLPFEKNISRRVVVQLALGVVVGVVVRGLIAVFGEDYLPFKLDSLFVVATWIIYILFPTGINLWFFTAHFIERWKNSLVRAEKLEREKTQVQFDALKNQLNPHFLFNALTSLNSLIQEDQALASKFLQQLSKVYRYLLKNRDRAVVSLDAELAFIEHYVSLVETRFKDSIEITFDIAAETRESHIVPVTLQILIENALKHNVIESSRPLVITIEARDGYLSVSNNVQIRKRVESSNEQGLENLKNLYSFLTPDPVLIQRSGGMFTVKVPLI